MHYAIHSRSITRLANSLLLLLGCAVCTTLSAGQFAPGIYVNQVSTNLALEIRVGYPIGDNKLLFSGLYNNGSDNVIELKMLGASTTGVSIDQDLGDVDSGEIFGFGDWCNSGNYAVMPYIKDFNVYILRYDLNNDSFETMLVEPSQTNQYTSTDCMGFQIGANFELVIGANNFDAQGIDYFSSEDDGDTWNLAIQYRLDGDLGIIGPFNGAIRDTHEALDDNTIAAAYQRNDGVVEAASIGLDGTVNDILSSTPAIDLIGNGSLKEMAMLVIDFIEIDRVCFGGAFLGATTRVGFVNTSNGFGALLDAFASLAGDQPVFDFAGFDITGMPSADNPDRLNLFSQSNQLRWFEFDPIAEQFFNPQQFSDFPFEGNGGPAGLVYANLAGFGRLLSFGVANQAPTGSGSGGDTDRGVGGGTFVATIDTATAVTEPVQPVLGLPSGLAVPLLNRQMLLLMLLLIAAVGAITLARRSG